MAVALLGNIFFEVGIIIIAATVLGFIAKQIRQPLIPAYILAGLIIGPVGLGWVTNIDTIRTLSEIGIAFLLFVVGLQLDVKKLKDVGKVITIGGTIQVSIMFLAGFIIATLTGIFTNTEALYVGAMTAFSSTMVVVKILSDKKELETFHGRIILGILLMEDMLAIVIMSLIGPIEHISAAILFMAVLKGALLALITIATSTYIFPGLFKNAAQNQEILFLASIAACFALSYLGVALGFSIVVGAFMAGIALGNLPYNLEIASRVKPLRDFFATIFFVVLGAEIVISAIWTMLIPLIVLILLLLVFKPILIMTIGSLFGYTKRTTFLTGISLAQISEFGLIIVAQGMIMGNIRPELSTLAIILATVTITITSYFIKYDNEIYHRVDRFITPFESLSKAKRDLETTEKDEKGHDIILIGYDRIGYSILKTLRRIDKSVIVVDFNPDVIKKLHHEKVPCIYGDIGNIEVVNKLNFKDAKIVISTAPDKTDSLLLVQKMKQSNHRAAIFVTATMIDDALELYDAGADYVILPHFLGGDHVSLMLEELTVNINKMLEHKLRHIRELHERKSVGHDHPQQLFNNHVRR